MTIALTIALATIVTFYSARLTWQYHQTRQHERTVVVARAERYTPRTAQDVLARMSERCQRPHDCVGDCSYPDCQRDV